MLLVHILRDGVILVPPFPAPKISRLLHAGSVRADDFFWHEGMSEWQTVGTRWEPDAGPAPESSITTPAVSAEHATTAATPRPAAFRPRSQRTSLLDQAKKRYHETLVPWAHNSAS